MKLLCIICSMTPKARTAKTDYPLLLKSKEVSEEVTVPGVLQGSSLTWEEKSVVLPRLLYYASKGQLWIWPQNLVWGHNSLLSSRVVFLSSLLPWHQVSSDFSPGEVSFHSSWARSECFFNTHCTAHLHIFCWHEADQLHLLCVIWADQGTNFEAGLWSLYSKMCSWCPSNRAFLLKIHVVPAHCVHTG